MAGVGPFCSDIEAGPFRFETFEPPTALRPILRRSFFAEGTIAYRSDTILPNGLVAALVNLGRPHRLGKSARADDNPLYRDGWLHGVQTTPLVNKPCAGTKVLGLLFEPIGFHCLFGSDMRGLVDRTFGLREILPGDLIETIGTHCHSADSAESHGRLHRALLGRPSDPPADWLSDLYRAIKASQGALSLAEAYRATGHSARHAIAAFKFAVGVSPKVLCRIYRLNALLQAIDPRSAVDWTALSHAHGFYDQAHFNHEFRKFSGLPPNRYLAQRRRDLSHLGQGESVHFVPTR